MVRSLEPKLPSYKQVQNIQDTINSRLSGQFPGLELQMQVQRINMSVVEGNEVDLEVDLEQIFNEADTSQAPPRRLKMNQKIKKKIQPWLKSVQSQIAETRFICGSG